MIRRTSPGGAGSSVVSGLTRHGDMSLTKRFREHARRHGVPDDVVENAGETDAVPPRLVLQLWGMIFTFEAAAVR
jgi:hypothetical protein